MTDAAPAPTPAAPVLRLFRPERPPVALGMAVAYLMTKPAFADRPFGAWSRILVGQINRRHYVFVVDGAGAVRGFAGWALATREAAEAWLAGRLDPSSGELTPGDCAIINAWQADGPTVTRLLVRHARLLGPGIATLYFKRIYPSGAARAVRLPVHRLRAERWRG